MGERQPHPSLHDTCLSHRSNLQQSFLGAVNGHPLRQELRPASPSDILRRHWDCGLFALRLLSGCPIRLPCFSRVFLLLPSGMDGDDPGTEARFSQNRIGRRT